MQRPRLFVRGTVIGVTVLLATTLAQAQGRQLRATLSGFEEIIAPGGAVFSEGTGEFRGRIRPGNAAIDYTLSYEFPDGTNVTQAHLHFGQLHTTGGIVVFLCANPPAAPPTGPAPPACPSPAGAVTDVIDATKVLEQVGQGFPAGDLDALITALRAGAIYVNVHTQAFQAGEIRGQVRRGGGGGGPQ
jgi:CHRD domain